MCPWVWGEDMHIVTLGQFEVGYKWMCSYMFHTYTFHCEHIWWMHAIIFFNNLQVQLFPPSRMKLYSVEPLWRTAAFSLFTVIQTSFSATVSLRRLWLQRMWPPSTAEEVQTLPWKLLPTFCLLPLVKIFIEWNCHLRPRFIKVRSERSRKTTSEPQQLHPGRTRRLFSGRLCLTIWVDTCENNVHTTK